MTDSTDDRDFVLLEAHAGATPVAESATGELRLEVLDGDGEPGRQALDRHDEGTTVGFSGSQIAQHAANLPVGPTAAEPFGERHAAQTPRVSCGEMRIANTQPAANQGPKGKPFFRSRVIASMAMPTTDPLIPANISP